MIEIRVRSERGNERSIAVLRSTREITERSIRHAWFELGKSLKAEANREILRRPKGGRTYIVRGPGGRRRRHVASAPGETHANLTGRLRRSLSWKVNGHDSMDFGYGVSVTGRNAAPEYGPFVEFGTGRMAARPSLDNAISATQRDVRRDFEAEMSRAFREFRP